MIKSERKDMEFISILFKEPYKLKEVEPIFFKDLRLDKIADLLSDDHRIKVFFYTLPHDKETVLYRQEALKDLENNEIKPIVNNFCESIDMVNSFLEKSVDLPPLQKNRYILDAALLYCEAVENFKRNLQNVPSIKSEAFKKVISFLKRYSSSEYFSDLYTEAKNIKKLLSKVEYTIFIKDNKVKIQKFDGEEDYSIKIQNIFSRFSCYSKEKPRLQMPPAFVNNVELTILEYVSKLYKEEFLSLSEFTKKYENFINEVIENIYLEFRFYLHYLSLIEPLQKSGLRFCYPEISQDGEILNYNSFDLALALQTQLEIVPNDFIVHKQEKVLLISGPNQGGKTTFARTFGQMHYLFRLGLKVPGERAKLIMFDNIFTHFEREEKAESLRGKLEDELIRAKEIIENLTPNSIVIVNEAFSSTSLEDGMFLAKKFLEVVLKKGSICVFVTFMHELSKIDERIVSLTSTVSAQDVTKRTFKIVRRTADGLSYALSLAEQHCLTYLCLKKRLKREFKDDS